MFDLLQINDILGEIDRLQYWSCLNTFGEGVRLKVFLPDDGFWLGNVVSHCALYNSTSLCSHVAISLSFSLRLQPCVFHLSLYPVLEVSLGWLNDIYLFGNRWQNELEGGRESRKILFRKTKQWHVKWKQRVIMIFFWSNSLWNSMK